MERANPGATRFGMALRGGPGRPLIFVIIYISFVNPGHNELLFVHVITRFFPQRDPPAGAFII